MADPIKDISSVEPAEKEAPAAAPKTVKKKKVANRDVEQRIPKWMDCTWRRDRCRKDTCVICSRISHRDEVTGGLGFDGNALESMLEDMETSVQSALSALVQEMGAHDNDEDVQLAPSPRRFALYRRVRRWHQMTVRIEDDAERDGGLWLYTEAAADMFWYANILMAKTYHQLCNRWYIEHGNESGYYDYDYTRYVLKECYRSLRMSLHALSLLDHNQKGETMLALARLEELAPRILNL